MEKNHVLMVVIGVELVHHFLVFAMLVLIVIKLLHVLYVRVVVILNVYVHVIFVICVNNQ